MTRLDVALVERGLARSRGQARELLDAGRVLLDGAPARKPATPVRPEQSLDVTGAPEPWVGRAAYKLLAALDAFTGLSVQGRRCLDVGASTGGFTQVMLARGAREVVALDVGHGQLAPEVAADERVVERSGTTIRDATAESLDGPFDVLVVDLSFISLPLVLPVLAGLLAADGDVVLLVKPQFEVGRTRLGKDGVVRSAAYRRDALRGVLRAATDSGLGVRDIIASPVPGTTGNREYLVWVAAREPGRLAGPDIERLVEQVEPT